MRWDGAVVMVTGASRGIGAAVAAAAAAKGARVGLIARSTDDLERVRQRIQHPGRDVAAATADITDPAQVARAFSEITAALGPCDVLVNNAGIGAYGTLADESLEVVERLMAVNYLGSVYATKTVLPSMIERGAGHVVFVGSIAGRLGAPFEAAYSASKFAMAGLADALRTELSAFGIDVSLVSPGPVRTEFFDRRGHPYSRRTPRPVSAETVAAAVIGVVGRRGFERTRPRWLRIAPVVSALAPPLYRLGARRSFRRELGDLRRRKRA